MAAASKKRFGQESLAVYPTARFVPVDIHRLRSAATMLFTPGFHARPVALFELGDCQYFVCEVAMSLGGEPVWVRILPTDRSGAPTRWTYHRKTGKDRYLQGDHRPVYLYLGMDKSSLDAAISDAESEGYML